MSRPRCARRARAIAQTYSGAANQATEAWVGRVFRNDRDAAAVYSLDSRGARPQTCFVDMPDVEYARSGEVAIAYQVFGEGPVDLVFARGFAGDLMTNWEQPLLVHQIERFASMARVLMLDKRGTGFSDGFREPPTLETRMDDLRLVMDAVGSQRAVLWSAQDSARLASC